MYWLISLMAVGVLALVWCFWLSIKIVGPNEVGIMLRMGKANEERVYGSGSVFVPWVPIRWDGHRPWELVLIPTKLFKLSYEGKEGGKEEHSVWSLEHQLLFPHVTLYLQFPYDSPRHLIDMIQRDVPFGDEAELTKWAEEVVIPALRKVLAGMKYKEALSANGRDVINDKVNEILRNDEGVFRRCGIYGDDPKVTLEGTGYARLEVEQVRSTRPLEAALGAPAIAAEQAEAAKETAKMNAEEVGTQILTTVAIMHGLTVEVLKEKLSVDPKLRGTPIATGGFLESFEAAIDQVKRDRSGKGGVTEIRVGGPGGEPMPNLQMVGGGGGFMMGNGGRPGRRDKGPKRIEEASGDEIDDAIS